MGGLEPSWPNPISPGSLLFSPFRPIFSQQILTCRIRIEDNESGFFVRRLIRKETLRGTRCRLRGTRPVTRLETGRNYFSAILATWFLAGAHTSPEFPSDAPHWVRTSASESKAPRGFSDKRSPGWAFLAIHEYCSGETERATSVTTCVGIPSVFSDWSILIRTMPVAEALASDGGRETNRVCQDE